MSAMLTMQQRGWEAYAGQLGVDLMQKTQKCLDWVSSKTEGEQILDVDCGQGAVLILLARAGKTVVGLTSDSKVAHQARSFISQEPTQIQRAIRLLEGTLLDIASLVDRSFDTILLPQSVALSERPEEFIEAAYRKLKAGGTLISLWPFGVQTDSDADPGYFLREPVRIQARHFETKEMRLFGDTLALVSKTRPKVLERTPVVNAWPDAMIKEAEIALKQMEQAVKAQLRAAHDQLHTLRKEFDAASEQLVGLGSLRAEHESHAATLKAKLEAVQDSQRDALAAAQSETSRLAEVLKAAQDAEAAAVQAAAQVQAQSRILELEQAQQIAVLRHEKLQRDVAIQDLERRASDAQHEAELRVAQARAEVLAIEKTLDSVERARNAAILQLQTNDTAAEAQRDLLERRIEEIQAALLEKQAEATATQQKLDQIEAESVRHMHGLRQAQQQISLELEDARALLEQTKRDAAEQARILQQTVSQHEQAAQALQAEIAENQEALQASRTAILSKDEQVETLLNENVQQETRTKQLIARHEEQTCVLQAQIAENQLAQQMLRDAASVQGGQIETLRREIAQRDTQIRQLTAETTALRDTRAQLLNERRAHESAIAAALKEKQAWAQERTKTELTLKTLNAELLQTSSQRQEAQASIRALQQRVTVMEGQLNSTAAELKGAQVKGRTLLEQFRGSQAQEKEALNKIRHLERRIRNLEQQKEQALQQVEQTRKTLSFQLGYALLHGFKSWTSFIALPGELRRIHKDGKTRRERKRLKQSSVVSNPVHPPHAKARAEPTVTEKIRNKAYDSPPLPAVDQQKLKVAGIMDEFTFHSYAPECELLQLRPESWRTQIDEFKPDLVFVESAWKGQDDSWKGIISNCTEEISGLLAHCRAQGIPSVFWNKEDPVHFSTFVPVATLVDHVFTTDVDCLPKYKAAVGHDRVSLLPFAAQPKTHNPIEKFDRKDAFNFAGSYYLRYPERQRDFSALIDTVSSLKPVEIYDRNYEKPHPHYEFPEKYTSMILGSLPFSEIDRAYKGYRYGVNMNTIKQSQTMYARRVFELLASNTVVVSNFSRGVRVMFGDLVVCSDDSSQIRDRLAPICSDDLIYRKFRLQGLRKVMSQHTYRQRLEYIKAKLKNEPVSQQLRSALVVAHAADAQDLHRIIQSFHKQQHANKSLFVVTAAEFQGTQQQDAVRLFSNVSNLLAEIQSSANRFDLIGRMNATSYYGDSYLTDLALACEYSEASAYTKAAYYSYHASETLVLNNEGQQYRPCHTAATERSLFGLSKLNTEQLEQICQDADTLVKIDALAIDEFNYCDVQSHTALPDHARIECSDIEIVNRGAAFYADLIPIADRIKNTSLSGRANATNLPKLSAQELFAVLPTPASKQIQISQKNDDLTIRSTMPAEKFAYVYATKIFTRQELNLVLNSNFQFEARDAQEIKSVFEFQDATGKKIAHQMNPVGGGHTLAIPPNCEKIRLGFRIQGSGSASISALVLGSHGEQPATLVSRSPYLILTKQYPAYDDLYRYGFLHSRVRSYRDQGLPVDVFRLTNTQEPPYREFEGVDVASGDLELLDQSLATGQYKKVLVHLLDEKMWSVLEKHLDNIEVDIWVHGAEIQVWQRREFEFERLSKDEIVRQKKLSDKRVKFWKHVLAQPQPHPNVHLIFVSQYFADEVKTDLKISLPQGSYSIIHNYIDPKIFDYHKHDAEHRKKILSIRPYASRKYANDLTVACILELSKRPFFGDLEFSLYGDGDLFDSITAPVRDFPNVFCHQRFLSQREIAKIHKENGIFLTPTRMDAQGVSRDEAMSSGLVPITNAVTAIPEFVDASCGYAVPAEDSRAMADAVEELYKYPDIFTEKSRRASERVARQCGFDNTISQEMKIITARG